MENQLSTKLCIIKSTFVDVPIETYKLLQSCITYSSIKYKWQKLRPNQLKQKENFWAQPKSTAFWFDLRQIFFKAWNKVVRKSQLFSVSALLPFWWICFQNSVSPHGDKMAATAFATPSHFSTNMKEKVFSWLPNWKL